MIFSVISEGRKRGCQPHSKWGKGWRINRCHYYCNGKVFRTFICFCDSDLCARDVTYDNKEDCSKVSKEPKHQLSMAMESPHDEVQWKFEGTKPGPEDDLHPRSSTQVHIIVFNFIIASEERRRLERRHGNTRTTHSMYKKSNPPSQHSKSHFGSKSF